MQYLWAIILLAAPLLAHPAGDTAHNPELNLAAANNQPIQKLKENGIEAKWPLEARNNGGTTLTCPVCQFHQYVITSIRHGVVMCNCERCAATLRREPNGQWVHE